MSRSSIDFLLAAALLLAATPAAAEKADRDKPLHLEAARVVMDEAKQVSIFEGNVELTQGTLHISADRLVVQQDAQGYKHCTATGQLARFSQKHEGTDEIMEG